MEAWLCYACVAVWILGPSAPSHTSCHNTLSLSLSDTQGRCRCVGVGTEA